MAFEVFDSEAAEYLREALQAHLKSFEEEHGIRIRLGNARFSDAEVRYSNMTVTIPERKADPMSPENIVRRNRVADAAHRFGLKMISGSGAVLIDYVPKRKAYPWDYREADGTPMRGSMGYVVKHFTP